MTGRRAVPRFGFLSRRSSRRRTASRSSDHALSSISSTLGGLSGPQVYQPWYTPALVRGERQPMMLPRFASLGLTSLVTLLLAIGSTGCHVRVERRQEPPPPPRERVVVVKETSQGADYEEVEERPGALECESEPPPL